MSAWKGMMTAAGIAALTATTALAQETPIVFVHGDSDNAGLWMVQMWRFESNGYPRDLLFPVTRCPRRTGRRAPMSPANWPAMSPAS